MGLSFQEGQSSDLMTPLEWRDWTKPIVARDSGPRFLDGAIVQAWAGSAVRMSQPPLDHHLIVLHQGGPKRVSRRQGREVRSVNVAMHACTTVEAGNTYEWTTEGPIAFAHIYIRPERFARVIGDVYGRDPDSVGFGERIGQMGQDIIADAPDRHGRQCQSGRRTINPIGRCGRETDQQ